MLAKAPWRQVAEDHGESLRVNGRLLFGVGSACELETSPTSPKDCLAVALLQSDNGSIASKINVFGLGNDFFGSKLIKVFVQAFIKSVTTFHFSQIKVRVIRKISISLMGGLVNYISNRVLPSEGLDARLGRTHISCVSINIIMLSVDL